ncbi:ATP-binding cassette domain-containing protein [Roseomonas sp. CECT 9278]|uniref:ATP-binding cassette domain-containing protein n=1 Tax=Roseomonas sp. CECT 9278 TaxID=2845823 RepID=UPI001E426EAE|nr:ATP-binding cassette domain-containing protein [Roseomonas sp. CECT 9278]CAH0221373.1 Glutamine transport ATP-binding protein GlnQ [Roseomonas sp. CECT 9278]
MASALLELRDATAGYAGRAVLHGLDLTLRAGEHVAVLGRSGAGKSTLLSLIHQRLSEDAALIPQAAALVGTLSVFHNVYMGRLDRHSAWRNLRMLAFPMRAEVAAVRGVLDGVGMEDYLFRRAGALSGGQQQRVSVARALYNGRPVVIGDEPVSALDRLQGAEVLRRLSTRHGTMVLAMHDIGLALAHAQRILVMDAGRIVLDAPAANLTTGDLLPFYG